MMWIQNKQIQISFFFGFQRIIFQCYDLHCVNNKQIQNPIAFTIHNSMAVNASKQTKHRYNFPIFWQIKFWKMSEQNEKEAH